jgi:hypothetical protein
MESVPLQRAGKDLFQVIEEVKERLLIGEWTFAVRESGANASRIVEKLKLCRISGIFFIDSTLFLRFYVTVCLNDGNKCQLGMETELGDEKRFGEKWRWF